MHNIFFTFVELNKQNHLIRVSSRHQVAQNQRHLILTWAMILLPITTRKSLHIMRLRNEKQEIDAVLYAIHVP